MSNGAILISGAARHSLGEAIVSEYLRRRAGAKVFVLNKSLNPDLNTSVSQILLDLNPLNHRHGLTGFAAEISERLEQRIVRTGCRGIGCLVQGAAVYDFGRFSDYDALRRGALIGLNILGAVEVLFAVMALNTRLRVSNETSLTQVLVGAFQGLQVREGRQLYASSKAWGIDLCTSLVAGKEVARCIYAAPGPIDTPMLHRNQWVKKVGGSDQFFEFVLQGSRAEYGSIFVRCEDGTLLEAAKRKFEGEIGALQKAMGRYRIERAKAMAAELGVMNAAECAAALVEVELSPQTGSGVYLIGIEGSRRLSIKTATFDSLDRYRLFLSLAHELHVNDSRRD